MHKRHGLFNALGQTAVVALAHAAHPIDPLRGTILGWAGWPVAVVVAGIGLVLVHRSRRDLTSSTSSSR